jgi:hypothetical protein
MSKRKQSKQDRAMELLGAIAEKLDKLLTEMQRIGSGYHIPYIPPPAKKPDPYPNGTYAYAPPLPSGTGKPWDDGYPHTSAGVKP